MSKPLTMSVCLAIALVSTSGIAKAGGHGGLLPSPQAVAAPQYVAPSAQEVYPAAQGYVDTCAPKAKHCGFQLPKICLPKISLPKCPPKCYEYEWVLKKKRCGGGLLGMLGHGCGHGGDDCGYGGYASEVYPTGQYASPQAYPSAQYTGDVYGAGQAYGASQFYGAGDSAPAAPGMMSPAPADDTDEAPEAPVVPSAYGRLGSSLFGTTR